MIRITGGRFRGQMIACPKGKAVRPVTAFVRESLFSILGPRIMGASVLDLFAGCGVFGLEALSRGAARVVALEKNRIHCQFLQQNRKKLKLDESSYQIVQADVFKWIQDCTPTQVAQAPFDLIFMDPPFDMEDMSGVIGPCLAKGWLAPDGLILFEHRWEEVPLPPKAHLLERRKYSTSVVSFIVYEPTAESAPE